MKKIQKAEHTTFQGLGFRVDLVFLRGCWAGLGRFVLWGVVQCSGIYNPGALGVGFTCSRSKLNMCIYACISIYIYIEYICTGFRVQVPVGYPVAFVGLPHVLLRLLMSLGSWGT